MSYEDKATWPEGPWTYEPDDMEWIDRATNLPCRIRRGGGGALCGYVAIPPSHPLYGNSDRAESELDAHGGITFTGKFGDDRNGLWLVGFDCGHYMDLLPEILAIGGTRDGSTYRTWEWVRAEVERLALQVIRGQDGL